MTKNVSVIPARQVHATKGIPVLARKRVCAYCRVSTDTEEQLSSYEAQVEYYTNYIQSKPEWDFVDVYADEGISGTDTKKRDEFNRMISDCEADKIDLIVTKSISRFARNTLDCLKYVRKLKEKGIAIFFEKENINTLDGKGEVLLTILSSLAQDESRNISENSKWGIEKRFQQGKVRVNHNRFMGYDKDENGELVINKKEAKIVRRIFQEYLDGRSCLQIARGLMTDGIKTGAGGTRWWDTSINKMLSNEKYCGDALLQKTVTVDFLTHKRVPNNGQVQQYYVEGSHEPIIPKEIFEKVQSEKKRRSREDKAGKPEKVKYSNKYVFSGKIYCSLCGNPYLRRNWRSSGYGEKYVWQCRKYIHDGPATCSSKAVDEELLKSTFVKAFNKMYQYRDEFIGTLKTNIEKVMARRPSEIRIAEVDAKIKSLKDELKNLVRLNSRKTIDEAVYTEEYARISEELEIARNEKTKFDNYEAVRCKLKNRMDEIIQVINERQEFLKEFDEGLFSALVERVVTISPVHFKFELKSGMVIEEKIK
jgi:DNA invertase Pin-like site-specific DNA recombinase